MPVTWTSPRGPVQSVYTIATSAPVAVATAQPPGQRAATFAAIVAATLSPVGAVAAKFVASAPSIDAIIMSPSAWVDSPESTAAAGESALSAPSVPPQAVTTNEVPSTAKVARAVMRMKSP